MDLKLNFTLSVQDKGRVHSLSTDIANNLARNNLLSNTYLPFSSVPH